MMEAKEDHMNIQWAGSPNFTAGRNGKKIVAIVNHITAGLMPGTLSWMRNPAAKASAHYLVTKQGQIYQMVRDHDMAWHAGFVNKPSWDLYDGTNPNRYTLGIEFECLSGGELTEPQYQAGLALIGDLSKKYGIPIDTKHIIGHYRIDAVNRPNDPGPNFPWTRLFNDLKEEDEMIYKTIADVPDWGKPLVQKLIDRKSLAGDGKGNINLPEATLKTLVILEREGIIK